MRGVCACTNFCLVLECVCLCVFRHVPSLSPYRALLRILVQQLCPVIIHIGQSPSSPVVPPSIRPAELPHPPSTAYAPKHTSPPSHESAGCGNLVTTEARRGYLMPTSRPPTIMRWATGLIHVGLQSHLILQVFCIRLLPLSLSSITPPVHIRQRWFYLHAWQMSSANSQKRPPPTSPATHPEKIAASRERALHPSIVHSSRAQTGGLGVHLTLQLPGILRLPPGFFAHRIVVLIHVRHVLPPTPCHRQTHTIPLCTKAPPTWIVVRLIAEVMLRPGLVMMVTGLSVLVCIRVVLVRSLVMLGRLHRSVSMRVVAPYLVHLLLALHLVLTSCRF